ncbi:MAG: cupin domain-containing protein [Alphaproteobacteria bacterium]|nr:cupin domain-containing protein [Alphaproteobacteria bacterium]
MIRGSKIFRPADVPESNASGYPPEFRESQRKRFNRRLGDHGGLRNFGVNQVRVAPGGQSSARHAHSAQDEFVYILDGELVLVTDAGREAVGPGVCIAFPAGTGDGHHFLNLTDRDATFLVVGDRAAGDEVTYPDIDLHLGTDRDGKRGFLRKNGEPYPPAPRD